MDSPQRAQPLSFRDPDGCVFEYGEILMRGVTHEAALTLQTAFASRTVQRLVAETKLVPAVLLPDEAATRCYDLTQSGDLPNRNSIGRWIQHSPVTFRNFPHEWPAEMLYEAASLTLEVADALVSENLGLKDATPRNILFEDTRPVFIDVLSIERRHPRNPTWVPYSQFVESFLNPLLANRFFGLPAPMLLLSQPEGFTAERVYQLCSWFKRLSPPMLTLCTIPTWLGRLVRTPPRQLYEMRLTDDSAKALYILKHLLSNLRKKLESVKPRPRQSHWLSYMGRALPYAEADFSKKEEFVREGLALTPAGKILDVGCNTGHFSFIAARQGCSVVAIDSEEAVVGALWKQARQNGLSILPLVVDISQPTPALGWRNQEAASFLSRAENRFDQVWLLGVLHHLLIGKGLPLREVLDLAGKLTADLLIIEHIGEDDPVVETLSRGRACFRERLNRDYFESECRKRFVLLEKTPLNNGQRCLYRLKKRA